MHFTSHLMSLNSAAVVYAQKTFHLEQGMPAGEACRDVQETKG